MNFVEFSLNSDGDPILRRKMVEESLARLLQSLNFHETVSSDLVFDCITKIIAKQVSLSKDFLIDGRRSLIWSVQLGG